MSKHIHRSIERFLLSPAYFILFSLYPVLWLYAYNVHGILLADLFRPLLISLFSALILFMGLHWVFHHSQTSALVVFCVFVAFFLYGHIRNLLNDSGILIRDDWLATGWLIALLLLLAGIVRNGRRWSPRSIAVTLNLITVILLLMPAIKLMVYSVARATPLERRSPPLVNVQVSPAAPDIYYIILDSYARNDVMLDRFGYDNSPFIKSLQEMGFYVANCSQSNYSETSLSMSSALNMDYLQNISTVFRPEENDLLYAMQAFDSNSIRNTLTTAGYKTVTFASGFTWGEWRDANYFISPNTNEITEFEVAILLSSYARILDDFGLVNMDDLHAERYRQRTRLILNSFDELLKLPSPKFTFIHIIAPHAPYGLDENGNNIAPDQIDELTGYQNQAKFISNAILPQLQKLINGSVYPPVIILQGDHGKHGSSPQDSLKILNAYYLPGHTNRLYPSISPVNSFRVVLNSYFGTSLPLLDDVSYYSSAAGYYAFAIEPGACQLTEATTLRKIANGLEVVR